VVHSFFILSSPARLLYTLTWKHQSLFRITAGVWIGDYLCYTCKQRYRRDSSTSLYYPLSFLSKTVIHYSVLQWACQCESVCVCVCVCALTCNKLTLNTSMTEHYCKWMANDRKGPNIALVCASIKVYVSVNSAVCRARPYIYFWRGFLSAKLTCTKHHADTFRFCSNEKF
jgi:hypothetical protein